MKRLLTVIVCFCVLSTVANASPAFDEIVQARTKFIGNSNVVPGQLLWAQKNFEKTMSIIEGTWIVTTDADLSSENSYLKICKEEGFKFRRMSDYSFEMFLPLNPPGRRHEVHIEYIFRSGISFNVRYNIEQQLKVMGPAHQILENANSVSSLLVLGPNTILEIEFKRGEPTLWGRCP